LPSYTNLLEPLAPIVETPRDLFFEGAANIAKVIRDAVEDTALSLEFGRPEVREVHIGRKFSRPSYPFVDVAFLGARSTQIEEQGTQTHLSVEHFDYDVRYVHSVADERVRDDAITRNLYRLWSLLKFNYTLNGFSPIGGSMITRVTQGTGPLTPLRDSIIIAGGTISLTVIYHYQASNFNHGQTPRSVDFSSGPAR